MELKDKANRPGLKFSEAVQRDFPGLHQTHASDAIWWAEFSNTVLEIPAGLTHPQAIRRWHARADDGPDLDALIAVEVSRCSVVAAEVIQKALHGTDLDTAEPPVKATRTVLPTRTAQTVNKQRHRAASNDEGSGPAKRALDAFAKRHDCSTEELLQEAADVDPDGAYRFEGNAQESLDLWRANLHVAAASLIEAGIPAEAIASVFINYGLRIRARLG